METKTDVSYGVIPYRIEAGQVQFFLIYQYSQFRDDTYWTFPKGHPEEGESAAETATRELYEETKLKIESLDTAREFTIHYTFTHDDERIRKSVTFFLGEATSAEFVLDEREVVEAGWFTYDEAREKITFDDTKKMLNEAVAYLKSR